MDTGRDLACPALWQESLERSLARRGRPTRSSLALFHLRAERDLSRSELLRESLMYSQLRRSAASRRPAMAVPASAGGISALALLAATTLPGLVSSRGSGHPASERVAFRGGAGGTRPQPAPVAGLAVEPALAARAAALAAPATARTRVPVRPAAAPAHPAAPRPVAPHVTHISLASPSSAHSLRPSRRAAAPRHVALARVAAARDASGGVAHAVSGGAAPAARKPSLAAARVPAEPQPSGHPSMGGSALKAASHGAVAPRPVTASHPVSTTHPVAATHPATTTHPATPTHPATTTHPVASTHPAPKAPAPAPPPPVAGRYVNPLAGASVTPERVDQGVDYSGSGTLSAIGDGKVTYAGTSGTGWPGAFVEYQLSSGAYAGRYVYYAESITPAAGLHVGQTVRAGQPIASIHGGIEVGWGSGVGSQPLAQADGQWSSGSDSGNQASPDGKDFSALIARLGGPPGKVEG